MDTPNKRLKVSPDEDYVPLSFGDEANGKFGYGNDREQPHSGEPAKAAEDNHRRHDRRHAQDRPKSKVSLPDHAPWILVRTKLGRKFVHNTQTKDSFWRIPPHLVRAVRDLELDESSQKEKRENAKWAEEQLKQMRVTSKDTTENPSEDDDQRARQRRSESLQREDELALMAELAAENELAEERDVRATLAAVQHLEPQAGDRGYDSDGESFEYVEVTDSEGEEEEDQEHAGAVEMSTSHSQQDEAPAQAAPEDDGPVEFGEDDIAFQLAAMGESYGLDPGEYGDDVNGEWEDGAEGLPLSEEDAIYLFRDLLEDSGVSPFTPWDKIIADDSPTSILYDDRYTALPSSKSRKEAWDAWTKDKIVQIRAERALMEQKDPRIAYLVFLDSKATPKLYWPEFKRKYKREPELNDRKLSDKEREKLYRDHISRLKLSESVRKADLMTLLSSVPLHSLNKSTSIDALPEQLLTHLHLISLPPVVRNELLQAHIKSLPAAPEEAKNLTEEQKAQKTQQQADRRRREAALAARERNDK